MPATGLAAAVTSAPEKPAADPLMRTLTTTVPRQYVHRAAVSEVFLTDWRNTGQGQFSISAQWPRGHSLFTPSVGYQDPLLLAESIRQIGSLLAHAEFDIPFGHQFLMWNMSYDAKPEGLAVAMTPTEINLQTTCDEINMRGDKLASMRYQVTALRDGIPIATGEAGFSCTSPAAYRRLRGERQHATSIPLAAPIDPLVVGRSAARDVVLSGGTSPHHWKLRADTSHPIFFDHTVDHVPGMVLLEAARQAAHAVMHPRLTLPISMSSTFSRYVELDADCWITAEAGQADATGCTPVQVTGEQGGETVFACTVGTRPLG